MGIQAESEIESLSSSLELADYIVNIAEATDDIAIHADGPVPSTWELMTSQELANFFRASYRLALSIVTCPGCIHCGPPIFVRPDDGCDGSGRRSPS